MTAELCIVQGEAKRGIGLLRNHLEAPLAARNQILSTVFATDLAAALAMVGDLPEALATLLDNLALKSYVFRAMTDSIPE